MTTELSELPEGTVTVMFTYFVSSSELMKQVGDAQELLRHADERIDRGSLHPIDERLLTLVCEELPVAPAKVASMRPREAERVKISSRVLVPA